MRSLLRDCALFILAFSIAVLCVWPVVAFLLFEQSPVSASASVLQSFESEGVSFAELLIGSLAWAIGGALVATMIAWPIGRAIGRSLASGVSSARRCASFALVVLCASMTLPPWLVYYALWAQCGPGSWLGDAAAAGEAVSTMRIGLLACSIVLWGVAPAVVILALYRSRGELRSATLETMDGWSCARKVQRAFVRDLPALSAAFALLALTLFGETVVFDLAQVVTYGFELRTLDATGASAHEVLLRGLPAVLLALMGAMLLVRVMSALVTSSPRMLAPESPRRWECFTYCALASLTLLPALFVFVEGVTLSGASRFVSFHGAQAISMLAVALASALIGGVIAAATAIAVRAGGRSALCAKVTTLVLLTFAVAPATVIALLFESAWNRPELEYGVGTALVSVYDSPIIVVLGLIARTGGWAALAGLLVGIASSGRAEMLAQLEGPSLRAAWRSSRRAIMLSSGLGAVLALTGSLAELGTTSRLAPPSFDSLATSILNAIHYQRPETVLLATALLVSIALVSGVLLLVLLRRAAFLRVLPLLLFVLLIPACDAPVDRDSIEPLDVSLAVGTAGRGERQFVFPRVLASDARNGDFYVIDKDARVQRFAEDGTFLLQWRMPDYATGRPTGASVAPDGTLVVADTHYYRIIAFSPEGVEQYRFGKYGLEDGSFIYPTDIAFGQDGELFVSEYGSNDRIQVFDAKGNFLRSFGSFGNDAGQFARPQSLVWDASRSELFVADSVNGRIQVFNQRGELQRVLAEGALAYPYGLDLLADGTLLVTELGAHRVQRLDAQTGASLGIRGGRGFALGQLQYPWSLAARRDGSVAILDSGNNRVQMTSVP